MGNYNDALMEQLADQGDGTYHYVDALDEARQVFVENLTGTLETVAKEAKAQVEFNPEAVVRWRLLGYENRDVADRDFRNDRIDAGELGAGHQATALYEVRLRDGASGSDRHRHAPPALEERRGRSASSRSRRELRARDLERTGRTPRRTSARPPSPPPSPRSSRRPAAGDDLAWRTLRREAARLDSERGRNRSASDLGDVIERAARIAGASRDRDDRRSDDDDAGRGDERERNPRLDED